MNKQKKLTSSTSIFKRILYLINLITMTSILSFGINHHRAWSIEVALTSSPQSPLPVLKNGKKPFYIIANLRNVKSYLPQLLNLKKSAKDPILEQPNNFFAATLKNIYEQVHSLGSLKGEDFLSLLKVGQPYNFAITEDHQLIITESGDDGTAEDFYSKHILLAKLKRKVHYAGEMILIPGGSLVVKNRSGSYKPKEEDLGNLVNLLKENLQLNSIEGQCHIKDKKKLRPSKKVYCMEEFQNICEAPPLPLPNEQENLAENVTAVLDQME